MQNCKLCTQYLCNFRVGFQKHSCKVNAMLNLPIESWKTVITKVIEQTSQKGVSKLYIMTYLNGRERFLKVSTRPVFRLGLSQNTNTKSNIP